MQRLKRMLRHGLSSDRQCRCLFSNDVLTAIEQATKACESRHAGEIRFAVETALPFPALWHDVSARMRAIEIFAREHVWDTEHNNGVLIYLMLAERRVEIVADRGISRHVPDAHWQAVVQHLGRHLQTGDYDSGLTQALEEVSALLVQHFPLQAGEANPNELSNRVVWA